MKEYKQLEYVDQLKLFHARGIEFGYNLEDISENDKKYQKDLLTISTLGYYQLKDYAYPYFSESGYNNLTFSKLVSRYYRDKRLRNAVEHAIEDIETTLNTKIAFLLGNRFGSFGYLDFNKWCQTTGYNKYINKKINKYVIAKEQNTFLRKIQGKARKSSSRDVKLFDKNRNDTVYLPIWLIMNELTLGDSIHIVKLMRESLRIKLAKKFGCTVKEFISWLECINLVRNICCHNGNLIDIELVTRPKVPTDFKDLLVTIDAGNKKLYTNNLAIIICIIVKLMSSINPKYRFGNLVNSIGRLLDEANSSGNYGFKSRESILECFSNSNIGKMSKI
ncbi:Abi family protein [Ligilactobacillus salivarius]|uniref:Uncharacterized protein n=1 Tax=Ligilactobacillus salivarius TaxID=1624 RepID=A0A1V9QNC0_9LACO|nr:Abi family protein [Ligilactobacillus salivarius]PEG97634.1 abortive phage resistance protein [Lactobacillus sp. UMNPBX9]PEH10644.1 abortive phage resistance protein [Lactobacillus sp. UMNPBX2]MDW3022098.1 Abi family protein [Ligilactobacillus salivarius]OQQ79479.1 hypothetical protein B6U61_07415 [Ligilactobacillus salivarius]OQQ82345.1 hypothetical protein B6U60_07980 [Ligilactobacillus salivarius]